MLAFALLLAEVSPLTWGALGSAAAFIALFGTKLWVRAQKEQAETTNASDNTKWIILHEQQHEASDPALEARVDALEAVNAAAELEAKLEAKIEARLRAEMGDSPESCQSSTSLKRPRTGTQSYPR